jgi:hypothetical protein
MMNAQRVDSERVRMRTARHTGGSLVDVDVRCEGVMFKEYRHRVDI